MYRLEFIDINEFIVVLKFAFNEFWGNNEEEEMRCLGMNLFVIWKIPFPADRWNLEEN